jgi:glycosyltransferase involved in cell wall biosynthesis
MKIAVITTFTDSLLKAKLLPLANLEHIQSIALVCDQKGPDIPKVSYVIPSSTCYRVLLHKSFAKLYVLFKMVKQNDFAFVMSYNVFPHGVNAWIVAKLLKQKTIIHLPGGYAELLARKDISDNSLITKYRFLSYFIKRLVQTAIKQSDYIFVPGCRTKKYLVEKLGVKSERILNIHSSIDIERFKPHVAFKVYDLILVSAFREVKRVDLFVQLVCLLKRDIPSIKAVLVGDGRLRNQLLLLISQLDLEKNIDLIGFCDHPEEYYWKSRIFVLASNTEGISTAVMESMACGLPAIVSKVGDMEELVQNDQTGYVIDENTDLQGYVEKIKLLLNDQSLYQKLSQNAVAKIRQEHSFLTAQAKWEQFLDQIIAG